MLETQDARAIGLLLLRSYAGAAVLLAHRLPKLTELVQGERHGALSWDQLIHARHELTS